MAYETNRRGFISSIGLAALAGAAAYFSANEYSAHGLEAKPSVKSKSGLEEKVSSKLTPDEAREVYAIGELNLNKTHAYQIGILDKKENPKLITYREQYIGNGRAKFLDPVSSYNFENGKLEGIKFSYNGKRGLFYLIKVPENEKNHSCYEWRFCKINVPAKASEEVTFGESKLIKSYSSMPEIPHNITMGLMYTEEQRKRNKKTHL